MLARAEFRMLWSMTFSIIGDRRTNLPPNWTQETTVALLGDTHIDASAGASAGAVLTIVSVLGDARVRLPAGSRVALRGFNGLGDRSVRVTAGSGPEVTVKMYSLFGDLEVTDGPA
jgi:hypothetical protein